MKLFCLHCSYEKPLREKAKLGEVKIDQIYFAKQITKPWKSEKLIIAAGKVSN